MSFESSAADQLVEGSRRELEREESAIEALAAVEAFDYVALYAQAAAHRAAYRHAGVFASAAIERSLLAAAASLESVATARRGGSVARVLHIATETPAPEGGHSRMIERWIRSDTQRSHSLVLTSPRREVPADLVAAIAEAAGAVHTLAEGSWSFMARAAELRKLAGDFDAVVLHTHPYDVVPTIALAAPSRPPSIAFNMAGHLFWIGTRIADVVASGRPGSVDLAIKRRGIQPEASHHLPVIAQPRVLDDPPTTRDGLRRSLGLDAHDFALITVASAYKLEPLDSFDLAAMVLEAIAQRPSVRWLVVGIPADSAFAARVAHTDRITCIAPTHDIDVMYAIADGYLDSHPFTSQTSLMDAAASGLPLVAVKAHPADASILGAWGGSLDDVLMGVTDVDSMVEAVDVLMHADREVRGRSAQAAVAAQVVGSGWGSRLEAVFEQAQEQRCAPPAEWRGTGQRDVSGDEFARPLPCVAQQGRRAVTRLSQLAALDNEPRRTRLVPGRRRPGQRTAWLGRSGRTTGNECARPRAAVSRDHRGEDFIALSRS